MNFFSFSGTCSSKLSACVPNHSLDPYGTLNIRFYNSKNMCCVCISVSIRRRISRFHFIDVILSPCFSESYKLQWPKFSRGRWKIIIMVVIFPLIQYFAYASRILKGNKTTLRVLGFKMTGGVQTRNCHPLTTTLTLYLQVRISTSKAIRMCDARPEAHSILSDFPHIGVVKKCWLEELKSTSFSTQFYDWTFCDER